MGFSNDCLITNKPTLKDQIERERYEHQKEITKQQDKLYLEEVSPMEKQIEELSDQVEAEKKQRYEDNETARRVIQEITKNNEQKQDEIDELEDQIHSWICACDGYADCPDELEDYIHRSIHEDDELYSKYVDPIELREQVASLKDKLHEQVELIKKVKKIYGTAGGTGFNGWDDSTPSFLDACKDREKVYDMFHQGELVEVVEKEKVQEKLDEAMKIIEVAKEMKPELKEMEKKAKSLDHLIYGIGWDHIQELCDQNTQERLIELGHFVKDDFA